MIEYLAQNTEFMWLLGLCVAWHNAVIEVNSKRPDAHTYVSFIKERWGNGVIHIIGSFLAISYLPLFRDYIDGVVPTVAVSAVVGSMAFCCGLIGHVFIDKLMSKFNHIFDRVMK